MDNDIVDARDRWIPEPEYQGILARVPIVCVDVLLSPAEDGSRIGLIRRETHNGGVGWCLVGGAVLRDEALPDAVIRHVRATLGDNLQVDRGTIRLRTVAEYFTTPRNGQLHDPRKHAVALTYTAECIGAVVPSGEALDFEWTPIDRIDQVAWGFGQNKVVERALASQGF